MKMLYTIVPMEQIFPANSEQKEQGVEAVLDIDGRRAICRRDHEGRWRLERLLSTDPNDFLDPRWQPGSIVRGF